MNTDFDTVDLAPQQYDMLMQSFEFIRKNKTITNNQIPDELLEFWIVSADKVKYGQQMPDVQLLVFMFVVRLSFHSMSKVENLLSSYRFMMLFHHFQLILRATLYARQQNFELSPFPVFNLPDYPEVDLQNEAELFRQYARITHLSIF